MLTPVAGRSSGIRDLFPNLTSVQHRQERHKIFSTKPRTSHQELPKFALSQNKAHSVPLGKSHYQKSSTEAGILLANISGMLQKLLSI